MLSSSCRATSFVALSVSCMPSSIRSSWWVLRVCSRVTSIDRPKGFGLTIGSDFYLVVDRRARKAYYEAGEPSKHTYAHGHFRMVNGSSPFIPISGVLGTGEPSYQQQHIVKGTLHILCSLFAYCIQLAITYRSYLFPIYPSKHVLYWTTHLHL